VCHQLGFARAKEHTLESKFGNSGKDFVFYEVSCTGTETSLGDCQFQNEHNCDETEAAGVVCSDRGNFLI